MLSQVVGNVPVSLLSDGHMTPEEVERHLESRQTYLELVPEKAPPTVPTEMFSNDPSLDRYVLLERKYIRGQQH
jgi:INO80 complex subunit E